MNVSKIRSEVVLIRNISETIFNDDIEQRNRLIAACGRIEKELGPEPDSLNNHVDQGEVVDGGCPRRSESPHSSNFPLPDHWLVHKSNGDRVCSYCGSLHPEDFWKKVQESAKASWDAEFQSVPEIEPSDKAYKIYVKSPGVRNASEGGIKFYTMHLTEVPLKTDPLQQAYAQAVQGSTARFKRYLDQQFPGRKKVS